MDRRTGSPARWRLWEPRGGGRWQGRRRVGRAVPISRAGLVALLLALSLPLGAGPAPVLARGEDVCPESNDAFQAACFLGTGSDALGFISQPNDLDAYRFEVYDYGATVRVALEDRPLPYRLNLLDWNGKVIGSGPEGVLQTVVPLPGSYYVVVDSSTGQFSDSTPYRIAYGVTYRTQPVPRRLYASEFRGGPADIFGDTGTSTFSDEKGNYRIDGGRIVLSMTVGGTPANPEATQFYLPPDPPEPGPVVDDFTLTIDTRLTGEADAGFGVLFRYIDADNYYEAVVSLQDQIVALSRVVDGERFDLVDWTDAPSVIPDGVNRTVVRAVGPEIRVNVNGADVLSARDDVFSRGLIGFSAVTWGAPPTISFDNILVTTPTRR